MEDTLQDSHVMAAVHDLTSIFGYNSSEIYVVQGSMNAGTGGMLFDSVMVIGDGLLSWLSPSELLATFAHELGHWWHSHMLQNYLIWEAVLLGVVVTTYLLRDYRPLHAAFGYADRPSPWLVMRLAIVYTSVSIAFGELITPLLTLFHMRHEYQADAFAASLGYSKALCNALVNMSGGDVFVVDPLFALYYGTHPSLLNRIMAMGC